MTETRTYEFTQVSRAYYFDPAQDEYRNVDEVVLISQRTDGNLDFQFSIEWIRPRGGCLSHGQIRIDDDALRALADLRDLFDEFATWDSLRPGDVVEMLVDLLGARDITPTENPHLATSPANFAIINADMRPVFTGTEQQMRDAFTEVQDGKHGQTFGIGRGGSATLVKTISTTRGPQSLLIDTYPLGPTWSTNG